MAQRPGPALRVSVRRDGGEAVLRLSGELDIATEPRLRGRLQDLLEPAREDPVQCLVVDASALEFLDVVGLGVLLDAHRALTARGGVLLLRRPSRQVRRVLEVLRVRLPVVD